MYTIIALMVQITALLLQYMEIGRPVTDIISITGVIPVMILNRMGK